MPASSSALSLPAALHLALETLLRFGYGDVRATVADDGSLRYHETTMTVQPKPGEVHDAFVSRIKREYDLRPGDELTIKAHGGVLRHATIVRRPRGA